MYVDAQSGLLLPNGVRRIVGRRVGHVVPLDSLAIVTLGIGYVIWGLILGDKVDTGPAGVLAVDGVGIGKSWNRGLEDPVAVFLVVRMN